MERVYSFIITFCYYENQYSLFIKVFNHVWNIAENITTFTEWDLRNL